MVCLSVGQSTMTVSPAKTDEPIEICRLVCGLGGPKEQVLDGGPDLPCEGVIFFGGGEWWPTANYRDSLA